MREEAASIRFEDAGSSIRCVIDVAKAQCIGHAAELRIVRRVRVKDERPVHASQVVLRRTIRPLAAQNVLELPRAALRVYNYAGSQIGIEIHCELEIDDGALFDTRISRQMQIRLGLKPAISGDAPGIVDPKDAFDFLANFSAIPPVNKLITAWLLALGGILILLNTWIGWHDQWVPDAMTYFYDHRGSDGDSESPLQKSLMASGVLGAALWYGVKKQLRKYMSFEVVGIPGRIGLDTEIDARRLVRGRAHVELRQVVVRVVGCNMEKGQYERGQGSQKRTVSFSHPVRAVILYERRLERIPALVSVERYLDGAIRFAPLFRALYPPQEASSSHGLSVHWEVQLIHDDFVDQELVCRNDCFEWTDFLKA